MTLHLLRVAEALGTPLPRPPPPPLKGTPKARFLVEPWICSADIPQEAIKDTTPATVSAEDDAALLEAKEEGGMTEVAAKTKHKTKAAFLGVFKKAGKTAAGFNGDVAVDGTRKQVGFHPVRTRRRN